MWKLFRKHTDPYERAKRRASAAVDAEGDALEQQYAQLIADEGEQAAIAALQEDAVRFVLMMRSEGRRLTPQESEEVTVGYQAFIFKVFEDHYLRQGLVGEEPPRQAGQRADEFAAGLVQKFREMMSEANHFISKATAERERNHPGRLHFGPGCELGTRGSGHPLRPGR